MYKSLINYINNKWILNKNQYGFKKYRSTNLALIERVDKMSKSSDQGEFTIGVYLNRTQATDTVSHNILLQKLGHYGVRGIALGWFKNYLTNRIQRVKYDNHISDMEVMKCGVPFICWWY